MDNSANTATSQLTGREMEIVRAAAKEAAQTAFAAGMVRSTERSTKAYEDTERRLRNLPILRLKAESDKKLLVELQTHGFPMRNASIARFKHSESCVAPEDALGALIQDLAARIAATEYEIATMEKALALIEGDQYADVISCLYFDGMTVLGTAATICCDKSSVFRHRGRLVRRLAVFLYGVDA